MPVGLPFGCTNDIIIYKESDGTQFAKEKSNITQIMLFCFEVNKGEKNEKGYYNCSADAVMLARYLADLFDLTEKQLLAADLNGDGEITSADAVRMARYLAGLIESVE